MAMGKWVVIKHLFVPGEVRQGTLLFVVISPDSAQRAIKWMDEQALASETAVQLVGHRFWGGNGQLARMEKAQRAYGQKSKSVRLDSLVFFTPDRYRFAIFHCAEVLAVYKRKKTYSISSRQGYFLLDRLQNIAYPFFSPGGTRRQRKVFQAIGQ
jgi:hypothetical protein